MSRFRTLALGLCLASLTLGFAGKAGAQAPSDVTVHAPRARVLFESEPEHLAIYRSSYRETGWATSGLHSAYGAQFKHERVCVAPCEATLPAGTDTFTVTRVSGGEDYLHSAGAITLPAGASRVKLTYSDRSAIRTVGGVCMGVSLAGLIYGLVVLYEHRECADQACKAATLSRAAVVAGVTLGSFALGVTLASFDDEVGAVVTPRAHPGGSARRGARGIGLRGHF